MYFITTIAHLPEGEYKDMGDRRCVGYCYTFEGANIIVTENRGDIWETIYDYCVIEKVESGIYKYAFGEDRKFYKFNLNARKYEPIDEPEEFKNVTGLGIG
jgi:hypothetical protein